MLAAVVMYAVMAASTYAASVTATITADNHYSRYFGSEANLTFAGRNELGSVETLGPITGVFLKRLAIYPSERMIASSSCIGTITQTSPL